MVRKKKRSKKGKLKLSPEERKARKLRQSHAKLIRSIFTTPGFTHLSSLKDKEFAFQGSRSDFDGVFIYENIVVIAEYTTAQESDISAHLKKKKIIFDKIVKNQEHFVEFLKLTFPEFQAAARKIFEPHHYKVIVVYASFNLLKALTKAEVPDITYLDYNVARYFGSVMGTVKKSARYELFQFLGLNPHEIGESILHPPAKLSDVYQGSILPEGHSHFGKGFKVISFYIDPEALLERCYVLRKYGWQPGPNVYQRMISRKKVEKVRKYLLDKKRVFINNIVVTLPPKTKLLNADGETINVALIKSTQPCEVQLPKIFNSIGIIDGQHRVFSYHEGGSHEEVITTLRKQQNLLVTGVVFPNGTSDIERVKFEATLFLEINSNQTNAKSNLKQEIGLMLRPFAQDSIATRVVAQMNDQAGPLNNEFERYFYEKEKMKTTSIVSYGVRHLVSFDGEDSLYALWRNPKKGNLESETDDDLLAEYVNFCVKAINDIVAGAKANIPKERWTANRKTPKRFLTTTNINGLVGCLRRLSNKRSLKTVSQYIDAFKGLEKFDFSKYKSSQYNILAGHLYDRYLT